MRRREFIAFLVGAASLRTRRSFAQPTERVRLVGRLSPVAPDSPTAQTVWAAFTNALRRLGWIEGQNLRIEQRSTLGDLDRARTLARELVELRPDVIVANTALSLAALVRETNSIPIVFTGVSFPIEQGFVTNLVKPGGNITGFTQIPEVSLGAKWVELLKEIAPSAYRSALMFNPETSRGSADLMITSIEAAATSFGLEAIRMPIDKIDRIEASVAEFASKPNSGMIVLPDTWVFVHRDAVIRAIAEHRLPAVYPFGYWARDGGLIGYGNDVVQPVRLSASYVDRILRGEKPGDLPIQQPTKFELVINLKTAKALGLSISPSLLGRADEVIE
jgi:putative tryptophan/tyrosine transport system substrate-binding protein